MMVSIKITPPKGGILPERFWRIVERKKRAVEEEIKKLLADTAKDGHKGFSRGKHYKNVTYRLRDSTKAEGSLSSYDDRIRLYVDLAEAPYGDPVIKGHGSWKGDPFINESITANKPAITKLIRDLYNESIKEYNRG